MGQHWWVSPAGLAAGAIALGLLIWCVSSSQSRGKTSDGEFRLAHPRRTLIVALASAGVFFTVALLSHLFPTDIVSNRATIVFAGFGVVSLAMGADYFLARHVVSVRGIRYGRLCGRPRHMEWPQVASVRYSTSMKWFRLESRDGQVARVSAMLTGLPEFARLVLEHGPGEAIDPRTAGLLNEIVDGYAMNVWA